MKHVARDAEIILGGHNVSRRVTRWALVAVVGDLHRLELDLLDTDRVVRITEPDGRLPANGLRVSKNARIEVRDDDSVNVWTDISPWVDGYERRVSVGNVDIIRLNIHADEEILTINGTTPWVEQYDGRSA